MNAKHMIQILPVITHISGWGDSMGAEVTDIKHTANKVSSFRLDGVLVRRVGGSGESFSTDLWVVDSGLSLSLVNMNWPGMRASFEQVDY